MTITFHSFLLLFYMAEYSGMVVCSMWCLQCTLIIQKFKKKEVKAIKRHDNIQLLHLKIFWTDSQGSKAGAVGKEREGGQ